MNDLAHFSIRQPGRRWRWRRQGHWRDAVVSNIQAARDALDPTPAHHHLEMRRRLVVANAQAICDLPRRERLVWQDRVNVVHFGAWGRGHLDVRKAGGQRLDRLRLMDAQRVEVELAHFSPATNLLSEEQVGFPLRDLVGTGQVVNGLHDDGGEEGVTWGFASVRQVVESHLRPSGWSGQARCLCSRLRRR